MKILHTSDLHLGIRIYERSLLEDQKAVLAQIVETAQSEQTDVCLIAGDVFDRSVASEEAVCLFDDFLTRLKEAGQRVIVISGNHDSAERIAFGSRLIRESGVHLSPVFSGEIEPCTLTDEYGEVQIRMLPFIKPADVRHAFPEEEIADYTDAVRTVIRHMNPDPSVRNVLVAHQFVTGAARSDSEDVSVGGMDNVDASVFEPFDYVALGHIHGPQRIGRETVRYCGTPLKYSFSERNHVKSVTVVTLGEKGRTEIRTVPLIPLHDMREIRGTYEELTLRKNWEGTATDDYLHVILTDENDVPDAMARLRVIYPNIMKVDYDNQRTRTASLTGLAEETERKSEMELFEEFYAGQNGQPLSGEQRSFAEALLEKLKEERA